MKSLLVCLLAIAPLAEAANVPKDLSNVRGFNYMSGSTRNHSEHWRKYNPAETDRDLDFAKRLNLNQVRCFIAYDAWMADKAAFRKNLVHFVRSAHQRGMGVMIVVGSAFPRQGTVESDVAARPLAKEWAAELVNTIGKEPGLAFWDAMNEPDWPDTPKERVVRKFAQAKYMADVFHELDKRTPVTIGFAFVPGMEEMASSVDVLAFHDYMPNRATIRSHIQRAKAFAAKVGKPLFNTEIGCVGRANPYDITIQEHMNAGVGWYVWELTMTGQWGDIHGVFYPDGTVRDPSIALAMMGFFRNRGPNVILENVDREGWVTKAITESKKWLAQADGTWEQGLDLAEMSANILEAGQLVGLRELPTRTVDLMRQGKQDLPALRALIGKQIAALEPFQKKN